MGAAPSFRRDAPVSRQQRASELALPIGSDRRVPATDTGTSARSAPAD
jgi:hypothetical protein